MKKDFDVFVIGSGIAGQTVAKDCARQSLKVAITDRRAYGGTCSNRGCDPKKVLIGIAENFDASHRLLGKGVRILSRPSWKQAQKFLKKFTKGIPKTTENDLDRLGITMFHQSPKFIDEHTVEVEGKRFTAEKFVIASGREPSPLKIIGNDLLLTSDDFLKLKKLPKNVVFIGAGYIGMEFAQIAHAFGAKVTLIETGERPLANFDEQMVAVLRAKFKKLGIKLIFEAKAEQLERLKKNIKLTYIKKGKRKFIKTRAVFNTAGRRPSIGRMNLEAVNVKVSEKGVVVTSKLQSISNSRIYACGDVSDHSLPLTPLSGLEGQVVAENILKNDSKDIEIPIVPSVVFTMPNIASVGLSEDKAKRRYKSIEISQGVVPQWYNAKRLNESAYAYKILVNKRTQKIVGAHLIGPDAAETINLIAMAINSEMKTSDIIKTIFTYPSFGNDMKSMLPQ